MRIKFNSECRGLGTVQGLSTRSVNGQLLVFLEWAAATTLELQIVQNIVVFSGEGLLNISHL